MFLTRVCTTLAAHGVPFAIVGGHAVALHGAVRGTVDVDFVIQWNQQNLENAILAISELGLVSRLPITAEDVYRNRDEYIDKRHLIAWNFYNPQRQDEQLDLIINYDLGDEQPVMLNADGTTIPVLDIERLLAMKKKSGRPQDLLDVEALEKLRR